MEARSERWIESSTKIVLFILFSPSLFSLSYSYLSTRIQVSPLRFLALLFLSFNTYSSIPPPFSRSPIPIFQHVFKYPPSVFSLSYSYLSTRIQVSPLRFLALLFLSFNTYSSIPPPFSRSPIPIFQHVFKYPPSVFSLSYSYLSTRIQVSPLPFLALLFLSFNTYSSIPPPFSRSPIPIFQHVFKYPPSLFSLSYSYLSTRIQVSPLRFLALLFLSFNTYSSIPPPFSRSPIPIFQHVFKYPPSLFSLSYSYLSTRIQVSPLPFLALLFLSFNTYSSIPPPFSRSPIPIFQHVFKYPPSVFSLSYSYLSTRIQVSPLRFLAFLFLSFNTYSSIPPPFSRSPIPIFQHVFKYPPSVFSLSYFQSSHTYLSIPPSFFQTFHTCSRIPPPPIYTHLFPTPLFFR